MKKMAGVEFEFAIPKKYHFLDTCLEGSHGLEDSGSRSRKITQYPPNQDLDQDQEKMKGEPGR